MIIHIGPELVGGVELITNFVPEPAFRGADRPARRRRTYGAGAIQSSWPTARDAARTDGESDPIDALAVTRAAVRQDDLPAAHLDGPDLDLRLLVDHREDLIAERTRTVNRLRVRFSLSDFLGLGQAARSYWCW
jgi:hypothetical protein